MFNSSLKEGIKCGLLIEETSCEERYIAINPKLSEFARSKELGDQLFSNTLAKLFFASDNKDEYDFGLVCAWYLSQNIYNPPKNWEEVEKAVNEQQVVQTIKLKMTSNTLYGQMDDWMCYLGLVWGHSLGGKRVTVPDPTVYIRRNLNCLFTQKGEKLLINTFIKQLGQNCPLFETGHFRETIEKHTVSRLPNYLSTTTAFALFRLQHEGYIELIRESDAPLMILPKANNQNDDSGRISHIIYSKV